MRYGVDREALASTFARMKKSVNDIQVSCEDIRGAATHTAWLTVVADSARVFQVVSSVGGSQSNI
jgi:hypothetical protein